MYKYIHLYTYITFKNWIIVYTNMHTVLIYFLGNTDTFYSILELNHFKQLHNIPYNTNS